MHWFVLLIVVFILVVGLGSFSVRFLNRLRAKRRPAADKPVPMVEKKHVAYVLNTPRLWTQSFQAYRDAVAESGETARLKYELAAELSKLLPQKDGWAYIRLLKVARGRSRTVGVTGLFHAFQPWTLTLVVTTEGQRREFGLTAATRCWLVNMLDPYAEEEIQGFTEAAKALMAADRAAESARADMLQARQDLDRLLLDMTGSYVRMSNLRYSREDNNEPAWQLPHGESKSNLAVVGRILDYQPPPKQGDWGKVRLENVEDGKVAVYRCPDYELEVVTNVSLTTRLVPKYA